MLEESMQAVSKFTVFFIKDVKNSPASFLVL
jgi:hypothetical protein